MQWNVRSNIFDYPLRKVPNFRVRIVMTGNQQRGQFYPALGFVAYVSNSFQYIAQMSAGQMPIEIVSKPL